MALIANPYSLEETLDRLRRYLVDTQGYGSQTDDALELLGKAVSKASIDKGYAQEMEDALLRGSTIEYRDLFSVFGDYWAAPRAEFPFYPHTDAVNRLDSAIYHIKLGDEAEAIKFYNLQHN